MVGSNGSGKSTLVGAIELALFADGSRDLADCLSPWDDRLEIELVFDHAGERYRVRRSYVGGARGKATLDFERDDTDGEGGLGGWNPLTRENTSATQALINSTLGLSRRTFGASAFLAQGSSGAFPEATAADRKAMLGEILDPHGFWPKVANQAKEERYVAERQVWGSQDRIADGLAEVEGLAELKQTHQEGDIDRVALDVQIVWREEEVAAAQAALAEAQAAAERVRTLTAERDAAKQAADRALKDYGEADAERKLAEIYTIELRETPNFGALEDLEWKVEEQRRLTEARQEALRRKDNLLRDQLSVMQQIGPVAQQGVVDKLRSGELNDQADEIEARVNEAERCQTCGQLLDDPGARQKVIDGLRDEALALHLSAKGALANVEGLEQRVRDMGDEIEAVMIPYVLEDDFAGQLAQARKTEARRIELGVLIQGYEEKAARLDELREAHELAQLDLKTKEELLALVVYPELTALGLDHNQKREQLARARASLTEIQQRQARLEQQIETLTQLATKVEVMQAEVADTQTQIDLLKLAERAFGRDGIPALIVESVIGVIEAETNRLLEKMPTSDGETFRVELRTQRALKTADHLKETLDIVVYDRDGERPYETYSGGEQARLNICLRIALALLLADRRGAESRLLVVDELEYLDQLGQEQLIDVIQSVSHRFDRTIIVSHHPGIRDAFDNTLRIVKDDGVSRVLPSDDDGKLVA